MSSNSSRSANSNSKRSRNSNSSIANSDGKRRKSNQKNLGAAWGDQSHFSSRSSFRRAPFSDIGSYMAVKNQKLNEQFDAEASTSSQSGSDARRPIFQGVTIFVDGFTIPSSQELRAYMLKHGGRFQNYFSKQRVTHIICSNLPKSKIKNIRSFSRGLPVVKPTWVMDSVTANKLLSWIPYQLDQLAEMSDQPKLSAFFMLKSSSAIKDADDSSMYRSKNEAEYSGSTGGKMNEENSHPMDGSSEMVNSSSNGSMDTTNSDGLISCKRDMLQLQIGNSCFESAGHSNVNAELKSANPEPSTSANSHHFSKDSANSSSSLLAGSPYHGHSTIGDPCFVENYFKSSRLHFIGTWRNRYRKRFFSHSRGSKETSANASASSSRRTVIHVDMDCFFVAVVIRNHADLQDKPVAVCHSDSSKGTAEISSANYPARGYGIKAGMFVRDAKALCPHLAIVPYNFEAYEEVADRFYDILHKYCTKVQAVSCDEAFLEVTEPEENDPERLASIIRKEIFEATGCTASAGISGNVLMARLATKSAKPDGQCYIPLEKVDEHLLHLPIKALPGVGRVLEEKLKKRQVQTCGQLRMISKEILQKDLGLKAGEMLWNFCRGIDNRLVGVIQENKSVGAEVNWGVRFKDTKDFHHFISSLCREVSLRLQGCGAQGRTFTLKIKKRRKDAGEPTKYMGCGDCENLSHSTTVPVATDDVAVLERIALQLFRLFHIDLKDIRGVGLQVGKLESLDYSEQGHDQRSLRSWLASAAKHTNHQSEFQGPGERRELEDKGLAVSELLQQTTSDSFDHDTSNQAAALPSMDDLDLNVIQSLPPDLISEINDMYGGKLISLVNKKKVETAGCSSSLHSNSVKEAPRDVVLKKEASTSCGDQVNMLQEKDLQQQANSQQLPRFGGAEQQTATRPARRRVGGAAAARRRVEFRQRAAARRKRQAASSSEEQQRQAVRGQKVTAQAVQRRAGDNETDGVGWLRLVVRLERLKDKDMQTASPSLVRPAAMMTCLQGSEKFDLMPSSLSQVDVAVLEQLPEELRVDIVMKLSEHRKADNTTQSAEICNKVSGDQRELKELDSHENLLHGSPPSWVLRFKSSKCLILDAMAEMYFRCGSSGQLSCILRSCMSQPQVILDVSDNEMEEATNNLRELIKQYINLKLETDMEEIYVCFRLLKRFTSKSKALLNIYCEVLSYLQAAATEVYGGTLHLSS